LNGFAVNVFLAQLILARRNDEVEGWMNLLFVIVVAVFWVLGGILKAKSKKPEDKQRIGPPRKPVRRPQVHGMQASRQAGEHPRPYPTTPAQKPKYAPDSRAPAGEAVFSHPLFRNLAAQIERATGIKIPTEMPKPQTPKRPQKPKKPQTERLVPAVEAAQSLETQIPDDVTEFPTTLLLDTSDPDDLRRAILYYEILGKPVSLRDSTDSVIGL